jgi:hypothetical protein
VTPESTPINLRSWGDVGAKASQDDVGCMVLRSRDRLARPEADCDTADQDI